MMELLLIGIGTGNPDHLTRAGEAAIHEADVLLIPLKGEEKRELADLRRLIVDRIRPDAPVRAFDLPVRDAERPYLDAVEAWHDAIAEAWRGAIPAGAERVALLVWGDPSLYDSTLRIAARLDPAPRLRVIPGITALQALTAAHAIPLNTVGGEVTITTGRRLRETGWPKGAETVAVMLDGATAFTTLDPEGLEIWWGAYLGMPQEILAHGPLAEMAREIPRLRSEARKDHGWIMDIYLLRRRAAVALSLHRATRLP
ncbi:precorrin-6A synthase (deacetylating) [Litorisediminicola beolgyonensis]|uniref:Precorrin-6A synthase [deacetylating] n=1 Tax=Litorisediminicola beolgyonensis TaxID=1173614 RepID=A0ABW3ZFY3_9RHOB